VGKLLELLKGIPLPPDIESELRILDLRFDQMEARLQAFDETETLSLDGMRPQPEPRYTTQVMTNPDDPTEDEAAVLKLMQPPGRQVSAFDVVQHLKTNPTVAQHHLSELQRKGYVSQHFRRGGFHRPQGPPTYSLTEKGTKYLVDHKLAG
jgi:hypothetical protein